MGIDIIEKFTPWLAEEAKLYDSANDDIEKLSILRNLLLRIGRECGSTSEARHVILKLQALLEDHSDDISPAFIEMANNEIGLKLDEIDLHLETVPDIDSARGLMRKRFEKSLKLLECVLNSDEVEVIMDDLRFDLYFILDQFADRDTSALDNRIDDQRVSFSSAVQSEVVNELKYLRRRVTGRIELSINSWFNKIIGSSVPESNNETRLDQLRTALNKLLEIDGLPLSDPNEYIVHNEIAMLLGRQFRYTQEHTNGRYLAPSQMIEEINKFLQSFPADLSALEALSEADIDALFVARK